MKILEAPAGSLTVFTEALTHGTARWDGDHERRTLLYKYCVSNMSWGMTRVTAPEGSSCHRGSSNCSPAPAIR